MWSELVRTHERQAQSQWEGYTNSRRTRCFHLDTRTQTASNLKSSPYWVFLHTWFKWSGGEIKPSPAGGGEEEDQPHRLDAGGFTWCSLVTRLPCSPEHMWTDWGWKPAPSLCGLKFSSQLEWLPVPALTRIISQHSSTWANTSHQSQFRSASLLSLRFPHVPHTTGITQTITYTKYVRQCDV